SRTYSTSRLCALTADCFPARPVAVWLSVTKTTPCTPKPSSLPSVKPRRSAYSRARRNGSSLKLMGENPICEARAKRYSSFGKLKPTSIYWSFMSANASKLGYSSDVRMELNVNGFVLPIGQLGPDFIILRKSSDHPPAEAEIVMWID